jgi:DNA primase
MKVDIRRLLKSLDIEIEKDLHGELWACCPYPNHDEKDASWSINEKTGQNHCFGCETGGNALHLIREVVGFSRYSAAVDWILEHNLDIEGTAPLAVSFVTRKYKKKSLEFPNGLRGGPLSEWITPPKKYIEDRGITDEQVRKWSIHYGVDSTFLGRIVLPVYDQDGILLSYAARSYTDHPVRYLAPKDGGLPGAIFGEQYWYDDIYEKTLVLCEGAFNALACERAGSEYVGALCGSNLDKEHLLKLGRFRSIIIASDLDVAGNKLAAKLKGVLSRWKNVKRVRFPKGQDANDIAIQDIDKLRSLIRD